MVARKEFYDGPGTSGSYTVIDRHIVQIQHRTRSRGAIEVRCECGNVCRIAIKNYENHKGSGCVSCKSISTKSHVSSFPEKARYQAYERGRNEVFRTYRHVAKIKSRSFSLSIEEFERLTTSNCHYCGTPPSQIVYARDRRGKPIIETAYIHNGLDRINSEGGYDIDNIVPCCSTCNYAKGRMSEHEFRSWIDRVYAHIHRMEG